ncbi:MAG: DUF255 domain-containing protein [Candidatus Wallbacteria bacterium]|nr:DUF255 domain-containing protein [Candidatus Wallbacteria bacterium]
MSGAPRGLLLAALCGLLCSPVAAANRLALESSPYLRLHAGNPVDWYPWGPEALERARREDRPIFVSIGYSTCHWCHVMAREVFSDPAIARLMNDWFVNVKVDREERPDLDAVYMLATRALTGSGGWPNSVFLTPDLKPFFAGTYFPPEAKYGKPAFPDVLRRLHGTWVGKRPVVLQEAARLEALMRRMQRLPDGAGGHRGDLLARVTVELAQMYDSEWGGFGGAPKFPSPSLLHALAERHARSGDPEALGMLIGTLERMVRGGIFDQLGGGFHRYATDRMWRVPHFEKMLHDNALLAPLCSAAGKRAGRPDLLEAARRTLDFTLREMTTAEGDFLAALDAQTVQGEGAFYVWTCAELEETLGKADADFLAPVLGFDGEPSLEGGRYVLHLAGPGPLASSGAAGGAARERVAELQARLLAKRERRPRPAADTKVLTDWSGMMIRGLALVSRDLGEPKYLRAAERAARRLLAGAARAGATCRHVTKDGASAVDAFLDDYAFLAGGLLALHEVTGERAWLTEAGRLVDEADRRLWDGQQKRYRFSAARPDLLLDAAEPGDLALPSGSSWMARCLVQLARASGEKRWRERARELIDAYGGYLSQSPSSVADMAVAAAMLEELEPGAREPGATVRAELQGDLPRAAAGGQVAVGVVLTIAPGWHVNSARPLQKYLEAASLELEPSTAVKLEGVDWPEGKRVKLGFSDEELSVFQGETRVTARLKVASTARPGPLAAVLRLRVQPCNDRVCEAPKTLTVPLTVTVEAH